MNYKVDFELHEVAKASPTEALLAEKSPPEPSPKSKLGIYLRIIGGVFGVSVATFRKYISDIPATQLIFDRAFCSMVILLAFFYYTKRIDEIKPSFSRLTIGMGIGIAVADCLCYFILGILPMSDFITIMAMVAIFNGILAAAFLGEPYLKIEKILGAVSFIGVFLIVRPPFIFGSDNTQQTTSDVPQPVSRFVATLIALFAALVYSGVQVSMRSFKNQGHSMLVPFHINLQCIIIFGTYFVLFGSHKSLSFYETLIVVMSSVFHTITLYLFALAFTLEKPSIIGIAGYSELVTATFVDLVCFGLIPSFYTIFGAAIIVGSCIQLVRLTQ